MVLKIWLLPLLIATSAIATPSPAPTAQYSSPEPPRAGYYPSSSQRPVYTAQRERDDSREREEEEPYPSTSSLGTAQTTHGAEEPENTGFVQPIDFKHLLRDVESNSKGLELGASASNPLFASESKNSFAGFFGSNNKDPFADFGGSGSSLANLATASSDRSSKNPDSEDPAGFVDPNVQFRSLFESSQTANNGFKPEDFLGNQGDSNGAEPSKGSQTRTFPSFTYSGRKEDESPNKYRASYRQAETQDDDYNNDRERDDRDDRGSYNDRGYYGGQDDERGQGPPPPSSNSRYNQGPRYSPATEETSNRPQSTGRGPKASASSNNPKCKKVEKTVEYENNDDYNSFTEPEQDYDPSTYRGRYKRQSRQGRQSRGGGGNKRPMTCYVCEDEHGRYAEKCSYDSKANPNKGEYFHSSSSAYRDNGNGRRPSGKSDRQRRQPSNSNRQQQHAEASATTLSSVAPPPPNRESSNDNDKQRVHDIEESEPKVIEKRQSNPDRYASNFGGHGRRNNNNNNDFDFNTGGGDGVGRGIGGGGDYGLPRGYIGNTNEGRIDDFDRPHSRPTSNNNEREGRGEGNAENNFGFSGNDNNNDNNNDNRGFDFENDRSFNDFNFGPPAAASDDFGRDAAAPTSGSGSGSGPSAGFNFDFSIPREYDPDVQLRGSNNNNNNNNNENNNNNHRPSLDGSASSNTDSFPTNFDIGYDDYVKAYFPDPFSSEGGSRGGGGGGVQSSEASTRPSSFSPSSRPQINHNLPSYRPRGVSRENSFNQFRPLSHSNSNPHNSPRGSPDKQHTQPSYNFVPPPNFFNDGHPHGGEAVENSQNLNKLMDNFSGRDRSGCQKIKKGDMSCYVCRDARGMNKEECMYASNDPKNTRMAYHEVTEYSSNPPASILPVPRPNASGPQPHNLGFSQAASSISQKIAVPSSPSPSSSEAKASPSTNSNKKLSEPSKKSGSTVTRVESMIISSKVHHEDKSPVIEYDFDY